MTRARDIANLMSTLGGTDLDTDAGEVVPHIKLDILYPAVAGKDLSGTALGGSYVYGNAHTDGRKYYYTDIKGSKPIKDPRIGAYFGSQRHKTKSLQFLQEQSSVHGSKVYAVDGREWIRAANSNTNEWTVATGSNGEYIWVGAQDLDGTAFMEITGYFNFANFLGYHTTATSPDDMQIFVNGGSEVSAVSWTTASDNILKDRFVDAANTVELNLGTITTPQITTLKIVMNDSGGGGHHGRCYAIELIAQDTTSTANKSKIQIPAQSVVSYGKKHSISATAQHYDPFNGFTSGADISGYIDEATSLGMSNWKVSSTWYRPFNGGRVVKWVDSSGTIKTSVTMMPPNAQNLTAATSNQIDLSSSQVNNDIVNFDNTTIANAPALSDDTTTFMWREFGNGSANGNSNASTFADASMMDNATSDHTNFVLDDGTTTFACKNCRASTDNHNLQPNTTDSHYIYTFVGTGVSFRKLSPTFVRTAAINLPYGTHIIKVARDDNDTPDMWIDGVAFAELTADNMTTGFYAYGIFRDIIFHQPTKPPIPKDSVVLADYCLYADVVAPTSASKDAPTKGARLLSASRDMLKIRGSGSWGQAYSYEFIGGHQYYFANDAADSASIPSFCTGVTVRGQNMNSQYKTLDIGSSTAVGTTKTWDGESSPLWNTSAVTLGNQKVNYRGTTASGTNHFSAFELWNPIRSSSYKMFESPFLKTLIGGDRSMEQDELIVTSDGKSWDEVTRDTSYIGNMVVCATTDTSYSWSTIVTLDEWRGQYAYRTYGNKDFAIGWDRIYCLRDGEYHLEVVGRTSGQFDTKISVSGDTNVMVESGYTGQNTMYIVGTFFLNYGDWIQLQGEFGWGGANNDYYNYFQITRA